MQRRYLREALISGHLPSKHLPAARTRFLLRQLSRNAPRRQGTATLDLRHALDRSGRFSGHPVMKEKRWNGHVDRTHRDMSACEMGAAVPW